MKVDNQDLYPNPCFPLFLYHNELLCKTWEELKNNGYELHIEKEIDVDSFFLGDDETEYDLIYVIRRSSFAGTFYEAIFHHYLLNGENIKFNIQKENMIHQIQHRIDANVYKNIEFANRLLILIKGEHRKDVVMKYLNLLNSNVK